MAHRDSASGRPGWPVTSLPDVAEIRLTRVKAHLVLEPDLSLIDCGYAGHVVRIGRAIAGHGRDPASLRRVVLTHGHPDHAGSAGELAANGAAILIHPADGARLALSWRDFARKPSRGGVFAAMTPEPPAFEPIEDGQVLPLLGGLRVIHTPGHTPGSVCLYGERDRVLFVGDVLQRRFGRVSFASRLYSDDYAGARRSVKRLAQLDVRTIVFSHFAPLEEGVAEILARLAARAD
ncbi:MAG TPA: MBL fold metallo-hydrolase [Candidatus Limnocylindrales bacterium]|nr:MBL fold metallo-hydrolase [Candidatus Limnocylindrales bacterium]